MSIHVPEHIINQAAVSAQSGAFFDCGVQTENTGWWTQELYGTKPEGRAAGKDRLVKRRKSPTQINHDESPRSKQSLLTAKALSLNSLIAGALNKFTPQERAKHLNIDSDEVLDIETGEITPKKIQEVERGHFASSVIESDKSAKVHFQNRNWCDGFRIVCTQNTRASDAPDANTGDRVTQTVTSRARGKIIDSGLYMQAVKGGFNSFTTVTLNAAARWRVDNNHFQKVAQRPAGTKLDAIYTQDGQLVHGVEFAAGEFTAVKFERTTLGQELSRFFDSLGKMHKRGFVANGKISTTEKAKKYSWGSVECIGRNDKLYSWGKVSSVGASGRVESDLLNSNERVYSWGPVECVGVDAKPVFDYLWCAEAPSKKHGSKVYEWAGEKHEIKCVGEQNYHAHVLMRWNVETVFFHEWAARIEKLWGQGFVTIERIKNAKAAASYLLKALGYMVKGGEGSQGEIRGNRYNISKHARAEDWENCATHEAQHMYGLIQEYMQGLDAKKERRMRKQAELKKTVAIVEKQKNINKKTFSEKRDKWLKSLENKIESIGETISEISAELNGNFALGGVAKFANESAFVGFISWAVGVRGWQLKTSFLDSTTADIKSEKIDESAVNKILRETRRFYDNSMNALCDFYSRFELVNDYGINANEQC